MCSQRFRRACFIAVQKCVYDLQVLGHCLYVSCLFVVASPAVVEVENVEHGFLHDLHQPVVRSRVQKAVKPVVQFDEGRCLASYRVKKFDVLGSDNAMDGGRIHSRR